MRSNGMAGSRSIKRTEIDFISDERHVSAGERKVNLGEH
jgi:hypothetical protein